MMEPNLILQSYYSLRKMSTLVKMLVCLNVKMIYDFLFRGKNNFSRG